MWVYARSASQCSCFQIRGKAGGMAPAPLISAKWKEIGPESLFEVTANISWKEVNREMEKDDEMMENHNKMQNHKEAKKELQRDETDKWPQNNLYKCTRNNHKWTKETNNQPQMDMNYKAGSLWVGGLCVGGSGLEHVLCRRVGSRTRLCLEAYNI